MVLVAGEVWVCEYTGAFLVKEFYTECRVLISILVILFFWRAICDDISSSFIVGFFAI